MLLYMFVLWPRSGHYLAWFLLLKMLKFKKSRYKTRLTNVARNMIKKKKKKSRIRETPTLSTDADSRTDTLLERLRDLPKSGHGPHENADLVHAKVGTWSTRKC